MIDVHLVEDLISEEVALAISDMEGVDFALNDQHHDAGAPAGQRKFRILLVELIVEFEEGLVH